MSEAAASWTWSARALGPFAWNTPFSTDAIAPHLPGYSLAETDAGGDNPGSRLIAATPPEATEPTLFFLGHRDTPCLVAVRVRETGRIANAWYIGSRFADTLLRIEDCFHAHDVPGRESDIFCRQAGEPDGPVYWFRTGQSDAGAPPGEAAIRDSVLYEISWVPCPPPSPGE
jgi:hypothetical protein